MCIRDRPAQAATGDRGREHRLRARADRKGQAPRLRGDRRAAREAPRRPRRETRPARAPRREPLSERAPPASSSEPPRERTRRVVPHQTVMLALAPTLAVHRAAGQLRARPRKTRGGARAARARVVTNVVAPSVPKMSNRCVSEPNHPRPSAEPDADGGTPGWGGRREVRSLQAHHAVPPLFPREP